MTTEGTRFLLLTLAVGIAAVNTGNNLFYLLLAMMLSLIVLSGLLSEQCVRRLDFHRHLPDSLFVNQSTVATLWIANHKAHVPSVSLRILDVVAGQDHDRGIHITHLAPGASTLRSYSLLAQRRGQYHLEGIRVIEIAQETGELAKKARDGKLGPADMSGGCFSISSLGGIGGRYFTPIINAPEVSIMGVCKSSTEPRWDGKAFQPRLILPLSLSWDHRVIDGAAAARFNAYLGQILADFRRVLL